MAVESRAPGWTPRFIDERMARRVYRELLRAAQSVREDPNHVIRRAIDSYLAKLAEDLRQDPDTMARADRLKQELLDHPATQRAATAAWAELRRIVLAGFTEEGGELRLRLRDAIVSVGERLGRDGEWRERADGWVEEAAVHVVTTYRDEITALITDTVNAWDAAETSRKIEIQVGRDLQFIRINGTVVGALAGLLIYTLSRLSGLGG
jgi:uncharacterized membrane-anchored protein YjiN (DUF445 family)